MNGHGERFAGTNSLMIFIVTVVLVGSWCFAWIWQVVFPGNAKVVIDPASFKEILFFVLGVALGVKAMQKGVEQGTTAALTPPQAPGTTTTTTTQEASKP
jgi:hypothetical protein